MKRISCACYGVYSINSQSAEDQATLDMDANIINSSSNTQNQKTKVKTVEAGATVVHRIRAPQARAMTNLMSTFIFTRRKASIDGWGHETDDFRFMLNEGCLGWSARSDHVTSVS